MEILKSILVGFFFLLGLAVFVVGLSLIIVAHPIVMTVIVYSGITFVSLVVCWIVGDMVRGI